MRAGVPAARRSGTAMALALLAGAVALALALLR